MIVRSGEIHRTSGRRLVPRRRLVVLVFALAALAAVAVWLVTRPGKPTIQIVIAGQEFRVRTGTTVREASRLLGLAPRAGSLLDVEGRILQPGAFPGRLLLDGRPARLGARLRAGDRLAVRNGGDRFELRRREVLRASVERPANPQFFVDRVPGRSIVVRGAVSHKLVSARFVADGPAFPDRAVALTFDDGPSPYTARIVAELSRLHVPATFFVIGDQAAAEPELVRREIERGMVVGNHSFDHPNRRPFARLPHARIRSEIKRAQAVLAGLGVRSALFRPPGGSVSTFVLRAASAYRLRVVLWSVDARDWVPGTSARQIVRRVLRTVRAGSIVELHDGGGDRTATARALPAIVAGVRRRGLRLVALGPTG